MTPLYAYGLHNAIQTVRYALDGVKPLSPDNRLFCLWTRMVGKNKCLKAILEKLHSLAKDRIVFLSYLMGCETEPEVYGLYNTSLLIDIREYETIQLVIVSESGSPSYQYSVHTVPNGLIKYSYEIEEFKKVTSCNIM